MELASGDGFQDAGGGDVVDLSVVERFEKRFYFNAHFITMLSQLVRGAAIVIDFAENLEQRVDPRVSDSEDVGFGGFFQNSRNKNNSEPPVTVLESLNEQLFQVDFFVEYRSILSQCE